MKKRGEKLAVKVKVRFNVKSGSIKGHTAFTYNCYNQRTSTYFFKAQKTLKKKQYRFPDDTAHFFGISDF